MNLTIKRTLTLPILTLAVGLMPAVVNAAVLTVPGDFATIEEAVDAANPGDTVQVESGTYQGEDIRIRDTSNLTIEGVDTGGGAPRIEPDPDDHAFRVRDSTDVTIRGFHIVGGERGVRSKDTDNVTIVDNLIESGQTGIRLKRGSGHIVMGNEILGPINGEGIRVRRAGNVQIDSNTIGSTSGDGIRAKQADGVVITNNVISTSSEHGIRVQKSLNAVVGNDAMGGNSSNGNTKAGIRIKKSPGSTVENNVTDTNGTYGIRVQGSAPIVSVADLVNAGNTATGNGTADMRVGGDVSGG
jgi:hypothetical protein